MSVSKVDGALPNFTYLQTARLRVVGPSGLRNLTRCVLDSGSQTSFISTSIIGALKLEVIDHEIWRLVLLNRRLLRQVLED